MNRYFIPPPFPCAKCKYSESHKSSFIRQIFADFPNGYQASIIRGPYTHGWEDMLWEVGIKYNGRLVSDTGLTQGDVVVGWLSNVQVGELLDKIAALPCRNKLWPWQKEFWA